MIEQNVTTLRCVIETLDGSVVASPHEVMVAVVSTDILEYVHLGGTTVTTCSPDPL